MESASTAWVLLKMWESLENSCYLINYESTLSRVNIWVVSPFHLYCLLLLIIMLVMIRIIQCSILNADDGDPTDDTGILITMWNNH